MSARSVYANEGLHVALRARGAVLRGEVTKLAGSSASVALDVDDARALVVGDEAVLIFQASGVAPFEVPVTIEEHAPAKRSRVDVTEAVVAFRPEPRPGDDAARFELPRFHWLAAHAEDPFFFREVLHLRVAAATSRGLIVVAPSDTPSLVPGVPVRVTVYVPKAGRFELAMRVVGAHGAGNGTETEIELTYAATPRAFRAALAELLLALCPEASVRALRGAGFAIASAELGLTSGYVESEEDMQEVLALRLAAYHSKDKFKFAQTADDMRDEYDALSRHMVCRAGGRIVAAVRIVFVEGDPARSEQVALGAKLPPWVFESSFGEISRLCTHPDYRGSDVLIAIVRELGRVAIQARLDYLLASCDDQCALWTKLGFAKLGVTYDAYGRKGIDVIAARMQDFVDGANVSPIVWTRVHRPMVAFLREKGSASPTLAGALRMKVHAALGRPLASLARAVMNRQRARRSPGGRCTCSGET